MILKIIIRNIAANFKKWIIICIILFVATSALITNIIGGESIKNSMQNACKTIFTGDIMIINPEYEFSLGKASTEELLVLNNTQDLQEKLTLEASVKGVLNRIRRGVEVESTSSSEYMNLLGVETNLEVEFSDLGVIEGRLMEEPNEAVISKTYFDRLVLELGDKITITTIDSETQLKQMEFTIVGILDNVNMNFMRQDSIVINKTDAENLLGVQDSATETLVFLYEPETSSKVVNEFLQIVSEHNGVAYNWDVVGEEVILASLGAYISILFLAFSCVIIICALIYNLTIMSIHKRMREIGTMLSMGFKHKTILYMVCLENLIVGMTTSILSAVFTILGVKLLLTNGIPIGDAAQIFGSKVLTLCLPISQIILATVAIGLLGSISALLVYSKIKRITPIEAMK